MLQPGTSRELFELWAPDPRNGLVVTGYSVEGTLARVSLFVLRPTGGTALRGPCVISWVCIYEPMDVILPSRVIFESFTSSTKATLLRTLLISSRK